MKKDAFKKTTVLAASVLLIILDQVTKGMVQDMLKPNGGQPYTVIPGLLELSYLENPAAAFGLFGNVIWLVTALTLVVAGAILAALFLYKHHSVFSYVTIGACFLVAHYLWVMHQEKQAGAKAEEGSGS